MFQSAHAANEATHAADSPAARPPRAVLQQASLDAGLGNQARLRRMTPTTHRLQAKLEIGAADDPLEHEADRVAEQVMRMPDPMPSLTAAPQISRKCTACQEEEQSAGPLRRTPAGAAAANTGAAPAIVNDVLGSPGREMDPVTRAFFEPRFGADLRHINIHTGGRAAASAKAVDALAYTVGSDIVFGAGAYAPETAAGRKLIAHELVHTQQQGAIGTRLQRAGDFDITGVNPEAASQPSVIFFDRGSFTIPASEMPKITAMANPPSRSLTLRGMTSEEGSAAGNLVVVNARIAAVTTALQSAGHTGPVVADPEPSAGVGQLDYRSVRAVEIIPAGAAPIAPNCQPTAANPNPQNRPCGSLVTANQPAAVTKATNANSALTAPTPATTSIVNAIFPGVALATIQGRLTSLIAQLNQMAAPTGTVCHTTCDGACSRPGYMSGQGATAVMTLCPDFDTMSADQRIEMLMHEGMHATSGAPVVDTAYRSQRLIGVLTGTQAETNTDSYITLILRLQPGASGPLPGGPPADTTPGMTPTEDTAARSALAFLEKWVEIAEWDTSQLYEAIKRNIGRAGGWDAADNYHAMTQHVIGWLLTLTDPGMGPASFPIPPTDADKIKVAGIHDRYNRMSGAVQDRPITLTKASPEAWAPNLGNSVSVDAPFFGLSSDMDRVIHLLVLMATSMSDIPTSLRRPYADAANQIRWHKGGIGP